MNIFRKKDKKVDFSPVHTAQSKGSTHPFSALNGYVPLKSTQDELYKCLREAIPIIDAGILKTVRLIGQFKIECKDKSYDKSINDFLENVQVNSCSCGITSFISSYFDQLLTYGTSVGEIVLSANKKNIVALYNANLENIELKSDQTPLNVDVYFRNSNGEKIKVPFQKLILLSTLNPQPGEIRGNSILKGLPFVGGVLLKIYNTIGVNWERVGNVRFAVTYKPSGDVSERAFSKERVEQIADQWSKAMRENTVVSDFVSVGDVSIKSIGADNQILESQVPARLMLEQIIAKLSIPPFLLGLSWSTTERMSSQQADILTSELEYYRCLLNSVIKKICSLWLRLNGSDTDFDIVWNNINLQDEVELANARYTNAQASEIEKRIETVTGTGGDV